MTQLSDQPGLDHLGDALSRATERDLRRSSRRPIRRIAVVVAALAIVGTGTAAAAGLFTPKQVAAGMPAGAVIFDQTNPTCVTDAGGTVFHCTLASAPAPEVSDFSLTKEVLVVDGKVAGGCIGRDAAGLTWDCYIGQDAVDHEIVSQDFLGEPAGPGRG
jgi:hypothetical protein